MKHWKSSLISFFFLLLKSQSFLINFCLEYCNYCDLFFSNSFDHRYWKPVASLFNTTFVMLFSHTKLTLEHIDRLGVLTLCAMENPWSVLMICDFASMDSNKQRLHQFSRSFMSDSLWPHESQHTRPPCPSPTPRDYANSCPSSWWCHPAIWSSVVPFSSCPPPSLPSSAYFQMSQLFTWGSQSIGVSASTSVLPMNTQDWSPLGWTGWISLQYKGFSRVFSNTTVQKHQFFGAQLSSQSNSHIHTWPLEKP